MNCYKLTGKISYDRQIFCTLKQGVEFAASFQVQHYANDEAKYKIGHGLKLDERTNTLSVDTTDAVEKDNTLPVTSAAVANIVGDIKSMMNNI